MDQSLLGELKEALQKEHDALVAELTSIAKPDPALKGNWDAAYPKFSEEESGSHSSSDEEADEVEEYEARLAAEHSLESRLLEVVRALERAQKQTYGVCAKCNKSIPIERLRANPAAEFCHAHILA